VGGAFHQQLLPEIEAGWPTSEKPAPFYHVGSDEAFPFRFSVSVGATNENLRQRITGSLLYAPDSLLPNAADFSARFEARYSRQSSSYATGFEAFHVLALATAAAVSLNGTNPNALTGDDYRKGMQRLVSGSSINLVPADLTRAVEALARRESIDLLGINSTLNWDLATGEVATQSAVFCAKRSARGAICFPPDVNPQSACHNLPALWLFDEAGNPPPTPPATEPCDW
jgi:hypothetical protein